MLDPAQIGKLTLPKPLADFSRDHTGRAEPPPTPQFSRQPPDRSSALRLSLATNHSSRPFLIASEQNIKIQCRPLKTKNGDPC
jgi:hypothetical protein